MPSNTSAAMPTDSPRVGFNFQFLDDAGGWGGHIHRSLIAFQHDQGIFRGNGIARLDQRFDDRYTFEVANVGNLKIAVISLMNFS